jgi:hypothetical protein
MQTVIAFGIDIGATKTGITVFRLGKLEDELIEAVTVEANVIPIKGTEAKRRKRLRSKGKEVKKKASLGEVSVINSDVSRCWDLVSGIRELIIKYSPRGIFVEMPSGGGQDARAHRLMGGATFMIATILAYEDISFEMFSPTDVEKSLGIFVTSKEVKERGLTSSQARSWKKYRMETVAKAFWPDFKAWPKTAELAEDAYDSAGAFICGVGANNLYARLKEKLSG